MSTFYEDLERAEPYFGERYYGNGGVTCLKCGAMVGLGWTHIEWHEAQS